MVSKKKEETTTTKTPQGYGADYWNSILCNCTSLPHQLSFFFLNSPFEVLIPAPGIPLCDESHSVVHRMIQPDHCLNSQSKSQVWGCRMVQSRI